MNTINIGTLMNNDYFKKTRILDGGMGQELLSKRYGAQWNSLERKCFIYKKNITSFY